MNYIPSHCFSGILSEAMEVYGVGPKRLELLLQDRGIEDISFKRISEYANGLHTPSFERARVLLQALEFPISDEVLLEALRLNRELIREENNYVSDHSREIRRTVRIKLRPLLPGRTAEEAERFLWDRIQDLCGERQLSLYLQNLIAKDLREYIINREEITQDEE